MSNYSVDAFKSAVANYNAKRTTASQGSPSYNDSALSSAVSNYFGSSKATEDPFSGYTTEGMQSAVNNYKKKEFDLFTEAIGSAETWQRPETMNEIISRVEREKAGNRFGIEASMYDEILEYLKDRQTAYGKYDYKQDYEKDLGTSEYLATVDTAALQKEIDALEEKLNWLNTGRDGKDYDYEAVLEEYADVYLKQLKSERDLSEGGHLSEEALLKYGLSSSDDDGALWALAKKMAANDPRVQQAAEYFNQNASDPSAAELSKEIREKSAAKNEAVKIQKENKLSLDALGAADFREKSKFNRELLSSDTSKPLLLAYNEANNGSKDINENTELSSSAAYMSSDERAIFNYYFATDKAKAEQYLDVIRERLSGRRAGQIFESRYKGKWLLEELYSGYAGASDFVTGVVNAFSPDKEYYSKNTSQQVSDLIRKDLSDKGFLYSFAYDFGSNTAKMAPAIITSKLVGPIGGATAAKVAGNLVFGTSIYGNSYATMINEGYTKEQARTYGLLAAASETGLNYILDGYKLGGSSSSALSKLASQLDDGFLKTALAVADKLPFSLSEMTEESLQEIIDPIFKSIAIGMDHEDMKDIDWGQVLYAGILGGLSAGILDGSRSLANTASTIKEGRSLKKSGINIEGLREIGQKMPADTVANKLANKVTEKSGAYKIARLFNEVGAELTRQNQADIADNLTRKGVLASDAETIATYLAAAVDGAEFTKEQIEAIENNPLIAEAMRETLIDPSSSVSRRTAEANRAVWGVSSDADSVTAAEESETEYATDSGESTLTEEERQRRIQEIERGDFSGIRRFAGKTESPQQSAVDSVPRFRNAQPMAIPTVTEDPSWTKSQRREHIESDVRESARQFGVGEDVADSIAFIAGTTGTHVLFVESVVMPDGKLADGYFDRSQNLLLISKDAKAPVFQVVKHELVHSISGTAMYDKFVNVVKKSAQVKSLEASGVPFGEMVRSKINEYAAHGKELSYKGGVEEVVAEYASKNLLTDQQSINELFKAEQNVFYKFLYTIRNWAKNIVTPKDQRLIRRAEQLYVKALAKKGKTYYKSKYDVDTELDPNDGMYAVSNESNSDGAEEDFETAMRKLVEQYGSHKAGFSPERDVAIPKSITGKDRVSLTARTIAESKSALPDSMIEEFNRNLLNEAFSYRPKTNKSELSFANEKLAELGFEGALDYWRSKQQDDASAGGNVKALGAVLLHEAASRGDVSTVMELSVGITMDNKNAAQSLQATRLIKAATPEGRALALQKFVDKENAKNAKKRRKAEVAEEADSIRRLIRDAQKRGADPSVIEALQRELNEIDGSIYLPEAAVKNILSQTTPEGVEQAVNDALVEIANQKAATWVEKWNHWRFLSMLLTVKAHGRNFLSNTVFAPVVQAKNIMKFVLESIFQSQLSDRTASLGNHFVIEEKYRDFVQKDWEKNKSTIQAGGKHNPSSVLDEHRKIYTSKAFAWLEWLRKKNSYLLEAEDALYLGFHYKRALAQYLSANKIDVDNIDPKTLGRARDIATKEAQKATFRDDSVIANWLYETSQKNAAFNLIVEGIVPFKKTPVNVLRRGLEYSPVGFVEAYLDFNKMRKGDTDITLNDVLDKVASGLTGSAILALGAFLAHLGIVRLRKPEKEKEEKWRDLLGEQNYSIVIGDGSYTIDWLAPSVLPLFVGAELVNIFSETASFGEILEAMTRVSDPVFELSMMQGIQDTIKSASYGGGLLSMAGSTATSYLSQALPTLGGQIARTVDDTRRQNYVEDGSPFASLQYSAQQALGKIPGLASTRKEYVNQFGETESTGFVERAFENLISPGYYAKNRDGRVEDEITRLYESTKEASVLPSASIKKFTEDKKEYILSAQESTDYQKKKGTMSYNLLKKVIPSNAYESMDDAQRAYAVGKVYEYATEKAEQVIMKKRGDEYEASSSAKKIDTVISDDKDIADYLLFAYWEGHTSGDKDYKGNTISGSKKKKIRQYAKDAGYTAQEIKYFMKLLGYSS